MFNHNGSQLISHFQKLFKTWAYMYLYVLLWVCIIIIMNVYYLYLCIYI